MRDPLQFVALWYLATMAARAFSFCVWIWFFIVYFLVFGLMF
jgi:hypothetical protein